MNETIPHSIEVISNIIKDYSPPAGPFDPSSDWNLQYTIWVPIRLVGADWVAGKLNLGRKSNGDGFDVAIKQICTRVARADRQEHLRANVTCALDSTATPLRWALSSEVLDAQGNPAEFTRGGISGRSVPGEVQLTRSKTKAYRTGRSLSDRWTIMEAVQRLPFERGTLRFDFLEDLETIKAGHRLDYAGPTDIALAGKQVTLHSFEQIGAGILPTTYWLDEQHRLLFVVGGVRAFVLGTREAS